MANKGVKYRLKPTLEQEAQLRQELGNCRYLWNSYLAVEQSLYARTGKFAFYYSMTNALVNFKQQKDFLQLSNAQTLQQVLKDLDKAIRACFRSGFGFPKFKHKGQDNSFRVPQRFTIGLNSIKIPKIGTIKMKKHRPIDGEPKHLTIKQEGDKWYVTICIQFEPEPLPKMCSEVGLDVGSVRLATTSDNRYIKPFTAPELERQIKRKQRELARRKTGSKRYRKTKRILSKLNLRIKHKRQDYLHKYSTLLVKSHDLIVVEDLKIGNMTANAKGTIEDPGKNVKQKSGLNQSILRQGWDILFTYLKYKCSWYGKQFMAVDPTSTSQICSECGYKSKRNRKSQSRFVCGKCHRKINADQNAARVILQRGLALA